MTTEVQASIKLTRSASQSEKKIAADGTISINSTSYPVKITGKPGGKWPQYTFVQINGVYYYILGDQNGTEHSNIVLPSVKAPLTDEQKAERKAKADATKAAKLAAKLDLEAKLAADPNYVPPTPEPKPAKVKAEPKLDAEGNPVKRVRKAKHDVATEAATY